MIKKRVRETAENHGYTSAYQLRVALGVSPSLAARLWKGEFEKIGIGTLDKLCGLLNCQPNQLLLYVAERPSASVRKTKGRVGRARRTTKR